MQEHRLSEVYRQPAHSRGGENGLRTSSQVGDEDAW
jgi:hypothetical protein